MTIKQYLIYYILVVFTAPIVCRLVATLDADLGVAYTIICSAIGTCGGILLVMFLLAAGCDVSLKIKDLKYD